MNKFFKKIAVVLAMAIVFTAMPMSVFAAETVVEVDDTAALQQAIDSAVSGITIQLKAGVEYGAVSVRPTAKNETTMYCGTHDYTTNTAEEFKAHLAETGYHTTPDYTTNFKNITINGADGAVIAGLLISSGHAYGDVHDYVRDIDYDSGSAYYCTLNIENFTVNNVNFTGKVDINTSDADSVYNGVTFNGCTFTTGGTADTNGAAIRYYNEANNGNVKNIVVNNCQFTNCYQGVYVHHVNGVKVIDSTFDTTGHNAIAIQGHDGAVALKEVVVTGNTFKNINDRIIRFNEVGTDSDITIQNNTATNSGDADGEVIKATSIASDAKASVKDNNWGGGIIVNDELKPDIAMVGSTTFKSLQEALAAAHANDTVTLLSDITASDIITIDKAITLDGNGHKLTSTAGRAINVSGADGVTIKNLTIDTTGERAINVIQNATNVTIDNVTATAGNYTVNVATSAPNAVVAIKGSTLNGLNVVNVASPGADVTVTDSTINCNDNSTSEIYAALCLGKEAVNGKIVATNTTVNVTAGSDSEKGRNSPENGTVIINGSTDGVATTVATIDYQNNYYGFKTLQGAIDFAREGQKVTFIRNITEAEAVVVNKAVEIEVNGKTFAGEFKLTDAVNSKLTSSTEVKVVSGVVGYEVDYTNGVYTLVKCTSHTETGNNDAVKATCTETGLTESTKCSKCNTVLKVQEIIPVTSHTWGYNTMFDAAVHWDYCHVCGEQNTPVAHSDADGNGMCECGWNFAVTTNRANPNTGVTAEMLK